MIKDLRFVSFDSMKVYGQMNTNKAFYTTNLTIKISISTL